MQEIILALSSQRYNQKLEKVFSSLGYRTSCSYTLKTAMQTLKKGSGGLIITTSQSPLLQNILNSTKRKKSYWELMILGQEKIDSWLLHVGETQHYYIELPCKGREVVLKAQEVLEEQKQAFSEGDFVIDMTQKFVTWKGKILEMTNQEISLLQTFLAAPGEILTRDMLFKRAWGNENVGDSRTVDVHVQRLRKKLGNKGSIETIYNQGYRFALTA